MILMIKLTFISYSHMSHVHVHHVQYTSFIFILSSEDRPFSCSKPLEYGLSFKLSSEVQKCAKLKSLEIRKLCTLRSI